LVVTATMWKFVRIEEARRWAARWGLDLASACRRALTALAVLVLTTKVAVADPAALSVRMPPAQHFRLQNGLDVVVQSAPYQSSVAVVMAYDVGKRDEPEGYEQLAHVVEHMTYGGSRHLGPRRAVELLERAGLRTFNGFTRLDSTTYFSVVPARALTLALWIESERMAFSLERFDAALLDHERAVVRNELLSHPLPESTFFASFVRAVFGSGHPYAKTGEAGSDLGAIGLDDARWFFQQGHRPSNAHLVVVGNVDVQRAASQIHRYFGPVVDPALPLRRRSSRRAPLTTPARVRVEAPVHQRRLLVAWPIPAPGSPERAAAEVLVRLFATRLENRLLHATRDVYGLELDIDDLQLGSILVFHAQLTSYANPEHVEQMIAEEFADIRDEELARLLPEAKARVVLDEVRKVENPLELAERHVAALRFTRRPYDLASRVAALGAVSADNLLQLRRSLVAAKKAVASLVRPPRGKSVPDRGEVIEMEAP
jgi:zinc protease